jgi:hypothetical protein
VESEAFQRILEVNPINNVVLVFAVVGHHHFSYQGCLYYLPFFLFRQRTVHLVDILNVFKDSISSNYFDCRVDAHIQSTFKQSEVTGIALENSHSGTLQIFIML